MLSREDFLILKQIRHQGVYIVDIATQIGPTGAFEQKLTVLPSR